MSWSASATRTGRSSRRLLGVRRRTARPKDVWQRPTRALGPPRRADPRLRGPVLQGQSRLEPGKRHENPVVGDEHRALHDRRGCEQEADVVPAYSPLAGGSLPPAGVLERGEYPCPGASANGTIRTGSSLRIDRSREWIGS